MLYPRDFGAITAGSKNVDHVGVSYNALRIEGYNYGALGLPKGLTNSADDCIFPNVDITTKFGKSSMTKARVPMMTGALGSTFIAAKYWDSFAIRCGVWWVTPSLSAKMLSVSIVRLRLKTEKS